MLSWQRISVLPWFWVGVFICIGLGFRLWHLEEKSLWGDELFTVAHAFGTVVNEQTLTAMGKTVALPSNPTTADYHHLLFGPHPTEGFSLKNTLAALTANNHPPLFFMLMNGYLHGCLMVFGTLSVALLRLPAVVFGLLGIPLVFLLGRRMHSETVGLFASAMMALSGYQLYHSQDARPYTLITAAALLFVWLLLRQKDNPHHLTGWLAVALTGLVGLYSHYFFLPVLLLGLVVGWVHLPLQQPSAAPSPKSRTAYFKGLLLTYGVIGLGFLPWVPVLMSQLAFAKQVPHYTAELWSPVQLPEILFRYSLEFLAPGTALVKNLIIFMVLTSLAIVFYVRRQPWNWSAFLTFCLLWLAVVYGFQISFDLFTHSSTATVRRYLLLGAPAVYLMLAYALYHLKTREIYVQASWLMILLLAMLWNSVSAVNGGVLTNPDYRQAVMLIQHLGNTDDAIVVNRLEHAMTLSWYAQTPQPLTYLRATQVANASESAVVDRELSPVFNRYQRVWLVWVDEAPSLRRYVEQAVEHQGYFIQYQQVLPKVSVALYAQPIASSTP